MANYLYNGVELPDINTVWTDELKETHPYAFIMYDDVYYALVLLSIPWDVIEVVRMPMYVADSGTWCYAQSDLETVPRALANHMISTGMAVWTSLDIPNEDGTVYLAASEPVPVPGDTPTPYALHVPSFLQGVEVGRRLKARRLQRQPVAYLYNGVRLPVLPEWDKKAFPCVVLTTPFFAMLQTGYLHMFSELEYTINEDGYWSLLRTENNNIEFSAKVTSEEWSSGEPGTNNLLVGNIVWSNHDIYNEDGTVFLEASDPVPVYE